MISWGKYSEDELRTIVKLYYKEAGFHVDDLHEADRRGEKGADLIVYKQGEAEKIAIALKLKPVKADIHQLQELAKRSERLKKYIYIQTPATDFYFEMDQYRYKVDFWDSQKLTYEISASNPSLSVWLAISSHPLFACIGQINHSLALLLYKWREEEEFHGKIAPDSNFYREIWRLKDDFSSLNKSLRLLQGIFENKPPISESLSTNPLSLLDLFEHTLDTIITPSLEESNRSLSALISEYGKFISRVVEGTSDRSNWKSYPRFDWSLMPSKIRSDLVSEAEEDVYRPSYQITYIQKLSDDVKNRRYQGLFFEISNVARILSSSVYFIECFIDDLFTYALRNTFNEDDD